MRANTTDSRWVAQPRWVRVVVMVALPVLGCMPPNAPTPQEGIADVAMEGIAFIPKSVTIRQGERVRWTNLETAPIVHTATSGDPEGDAIGMIWASGNLDPGESFTRVFDEVGEFEYFCEIHPFVPAMRHATVIVEP